MQSNALKKEEFFQAPAATKKLSLKVDNSVSWESFRAEIAQQSTAACNLPGNLNCPDFEDFLDSDFA